MMKTVAGAKAYREAAVGESRKRLPSCEDHFGVVWLNGKNAVILGVFQ